MLPAMSMASTTMTFTPSCRVWSMDRVGSTEIPKVIPLRKTSAPTSTVPVMDTSGTLVMVGSALIERAGGVVSMVMVTFDSAMLPATSLAWTISDTSPSARSDRVRVQSPVPAMFIMFQLSPPSVLYSTISRPEPTSATKPKVSTLLFAKMAPSKGSVMATTGGKASHRIRWTISLPIRSLSRTTSVSLVAPDAATFMV